MKKLEPKKQAHRFISIDKIYIGDNVRTVFDESKIIELAKSIKLHGLLEPVIVEETEKGFLITAGERRFRAVRYLYDVEKLEGYFEIECIVKPSNNRLELQLIENIQREDLSGAELERAVKGLIEEYGYSQSEVGRRLGKSESWISSVLAAGRLRESAIENNPDVGRLSTGAASELERVPEQLRDRAVRNAIDGGGTVKAAREAKQRVKAESEAKKPVLKKEQFPKRKELKCPHCGEVIEL